MHAHPDTNRSALQSFRYQTGGLQRVRCPREGQEERVALRIDLCPAKRRTRLTDDPPMLAEHGGVRIRTELVEQPRRALHISEHERHCPRGQTTAPGGGEVERRVVEQDLLLELLQRLAGVEAELVDEPGARVLVGGECVRLPAGAVEREDQQPGEALAQRVVANEPFELADDLGVAAEREVGLEAQLERGQPQLLEPADLVARERLVLELRKR